MARAKTLGVPLDFISPSEARAMCPVLEDRGILAMTYNPTDCNVEPSQVPVGYARAAEELGVTVLANTPATGLVLGNGRRREGGHAAGRDQDASRWWTRPAPGCGWWPS